MSFVKQSTCSFKRLAYATQSITSKANEPAEEENKNKNKCDLGVITITIKLAINVLNITISIVSIIYFSTPHFRHLHGIAYTQYQHMYTNVPFYSYFYYYFFLFYWLHKQMILHTAPSFKQHIKYAPVLTLQESTIYTQTNIIRFNHTNT